MDGKNDAVVHSSDGLKRTIEAFAAAEQRRRARLGAAEKASVAVEVVGSAVPSG